MLFLATLFCCWAVTSVSSQDCTSDSDCTNKLACMDNKCGDPCPRYCGVNARCAVWNHLGACQCKPGFSGDPLAKCTAITTTTTQATMPKQSDEDCTSDSDCTNKLACINKKCGNPCPKYCGVNARCAVWNHLGACQCKPGFSGDPLGTCTAITSTTRSPVIGVHTFQTPKIIVGPASYFTTTHKIPLTTTQKTAQDLSKCTKSKTRINGQVHLAVCSGALLFEDHFNTGQLNATKWTREQYVAEGPDNEFVTYEQRAQNGFIKNGALHLVATLRDDPTVSQIDLISGCTSTFCSVSVSPQQTLLPPIVAAKIKSTFSFLYGKVEIRAQLPKGDWIVPQVNLDPPGQFSYEKGRLWVAYARGNQDLRRHETGEQIGNSVLYAGGVLGQGEPLRTHAALRVAGEGGWGDAFHVYTMVWAPEGIQILVDGEDKGYISSPYTGSGPSNGAPFNKEVVISLGIAAGGFSDFPDGSTSNGNRKPWKKLSVRPMANFYRSKDQWYPTWAGDNSALKIDYVKVWAL